MRQPDLFNPVLADLDPQTQEYLFAKQVLQNEPCPRADLFEHGTAFTDRDLFLRFTLHPDDRTDAKQVALAFELLDLHGQRIGQFLVQTRD